MFAHINNTIIDGSNPPGPNLGSCVTMVNGEDSNTILEGFTLTGGVGTKWEDPHYHTFYREGGGILMEDASPVIRNNIIIDNEAIDATGVVSAGGGGIRISDGNPLIENNVIMNNRGLYGAGIVLNFASGIIRNNVIAFNTGGEDYGGSGIWTYEDFEDGPSIIENNTIIYNTSDLYGGGIYCWNTTIMASNNIVWGNTSVFGHSQITINGAADISCSNIQDGWPGETNMSYNPIFCDLEANNFSLDSLSPCSPDHPLNVCGELLGALAPACPETNNPDQADSDDNGVGDVCDYICGDTNGDGSVNILDIVYLISFLYKDGPEPACS